MAGVHVPLHSAEHFYVVTDQVEGVHPDLPILRDPDGYTYFKEEVGGLVVGGFEPEAKPWVSPDQVPYPFEFALLDEDWDHFAVLMDSALHRIPVLAETGIRKFYNGPESFTPDNQFLMGEAPGVRGFFVGAGFNSVGIASARRRWPGPGRVGGRGRADQRPGRRGHPPVRPVPRRAGVAAPTGRGDPRAALRGAVAPTGSWRAPGPSGCPRSTTGWPPGTPASARRWAGNAPTSSRRPARSRSSTTRGASPPGCRGRPPSSARHVPRSPSSTRPRSRSTSSTGRDAEASLQWICTNDVAVPVGTVVYTGLLNRRGTYEADLTVTRVAEDEFLLVSGSATTERDQDWIRRNIPAGHDTAVADVTPSYAVLGVMGPRSRELLARVSGDPLGDPFATSRLVRIAGADVRASRITYVGGARLGAVRRDGLRGRRVRRAHGGHRPGRSSTRATTRSSRCGSRRATAPSAAN